MSVFSEPSETACMVLHTSSRVLMMPGGRCKQNIDLVISINLQDIETPNVLGNCRLTIGVEYNGLLNTSFKM